VAGADPQGSWMADTPQGRVMRYGAMIGMPPPPVGGSPGGMAGPEPGQPSRPTRGSAAPSAPAAAAGRAAERDGAGIVGGGSVVGGRPGQDGRRRRSEAYVEWKVPKGVPPVLEPGPEPVHDPGPGVIGIDR
jgi:hypothetical protein